MGFGGKKRFEVLGGGVVVARAGTQMNCAGIAAVTVKIGAEATPGLQLTFRERSDWSGGGFGAQVPGASVPTFVRDAFTEGVEEAYREHSVPDGIAVEVIEAFVHPVDASSQRFSEAGYRAIVGWLSLCDNES